MVHSDNAKSKLARIVEKVGDLPVAPAVIGSLMTLTSDLKSNIADISRILMSDQSLVAKVLKLSNSPYYGRAREVQTLPEAIVVLGFATVRSLVVTAAAHQMFSSDDENSPRSKLWRHALSSAIAARLLTQRAKQPDKEEAYIAALLHDIGKLVMLEKLPEWYNKMIEEIEKENSSFREVESRIFHFDHCDVASLLLAKWSFPAELVRAITKHHESPSFGKGDAIPLAHIVNLASYISKTLDLSFNDERAEDITLLEPAIAMKLDPDSLEKLTEEITEQFQYEILIFQDM